MTVDGQAIAKEILGEVRAAVATAATAPTLVIVTAAPNLETQKYLALKKRKAASVGIRVNVIELLDDCSTDDVVATITKASETATGIVVQLPLPATIDTDRVLAAIPYAHDVDAIHYSGEANESLPPVVGAVARIAQSAELLLADKTVTIVGAGRLVGAPALLWATGQGSQVTLITQDTPTQEAAKALQQAEVIISGAGAPGLITPDKIRSGVAIFDAGTSEDGGTLVGDADPACADVARLFTPVPGGIGPITIACLFKNLIQLSRQ